MIYAFKPAGILPFEQRKDILKIKEMNPGKEIRVYEIFSKESNGLVEYFITSSFPLSTSIYASPLGGMNDLNEVQDLFRKEYPSCECKEVDPDTFVRD